MLISYLAYLLISTKLLLLTRSFTSVNVSTFTLLLSKMQNLARLSFRLFKNTNRQRKFCTATGLCDNNDKYILKSFLPDIVIPDINFVDKVWLQMDRFKNHVAVECAITNRSYTYTELKQLSAVFATSLHKKLGLSRKDVVGVVLPNIPEFAVIAVGTLQAGCVLAPFNPMYKTLEMMHQISTTDPKVIITIPELYNTVAESLEKAKKSAKIVVIAKPSDAVPSGAIRFFEIVAEGVDFPLLDKVRSSLDEVAVIVFSSGTSGLPKGVEVTGRNLFAALECMYNDRTCFPIMTNGEFQDVVPCFLPFFHIFGLVVSLFGHLGMGSKLVSMPKFTPELYLDVLRTRNPSLLFVVPPIIQLLARHPAVKEEYFRNVRHIVCGAAPIGALEIKALLNKVKNNVEFNQGFGASETAAMGTSTFTKYKEVDFEACGVPMASTAMKFIDTAGEHVPIGQPGELCIKGPYVMKGYCKNEAATAECMTEDGFYKTGDFGYYKKGVGLFITDRIKELIKVKGMQVAPAELENILCSHPSVLDAGVIGMPHPYRGEAPKAFVTLKPGQNVSSEELKKFVEDRVSSFKKIEDVVFVGSIPKSNTGKILRRVLKEYA